MLCRSKYENLISELNIRPLRIQAGARLVVKATEEGIVVDADASSAVDSQTTGIGNEEEAEAETAEATA